MDIEKLKKNIKFYEDETKKALEQNDIDKAIDCRLIMKELEEELEKSE